MAMMMMTTLMMMHAVGDGIKTTASGQLEHTTIRIAVTELLLIFLYHYFSVTSSKW